MRASIWSRVPIQYIWKNVWGLAATTSSIGLLANELRPIAVPRAAAARATATSPSGWTACTPVGEMMTGNEIGWPITVGRRGRAGPRGPRRAARSRARRTRHVVLDGDAPLGAGDERAVDRLGQPPLRASLRLGDGLEPLVSHCDPLVMPCPTRPGDTSIGNREDSKTGGSYNPRSAERCAVENRC